MSKHGLFNIFRKKQWRPPYHPELYCLRNIIGYSGDLKLGPTVYFQGGIAFGWITQTGLKVFLGREEMKLGTQDYEFSIRNMDFTQTGSKIQIGWFDGENLVRMYSTFVGQFVSLSTAADSKSREKTLHILAKAIRKFPYEKQMSGAPGLYFAERGRTPSHLDDGSLRYLTESGRTMRSSSRWSVSTDDV